MFGWAPGRANCRCRWRKLTLRIERQVAVLTYNDALIMMAWVSCLAVPMLQLTERYRLTENPLAAE